MLLSEIPKTCTGLKKLPLLCVLTQCIEFPAVIPFDVFTIYESLAIEFITLSMQIFHLEKEWNKWSGFWEAWKLSCSGNSLLDPIFYKQQQHLYNIWLTRPLNWEQPFKLLWLFMAQFGMSHFICLGFPVDLLKGQFCRRFATAAHFVAHEKYGFVELIKTILPIHSFPFLFIYIYFDKISWSAPILRQMWQANVDVIRPIIMFCLISGFTPPPLFLLVKTFHQVFRDITYTCTLLLLCFISVLLSDGFVQEIKSVGVYLMMFAAADWR